MFHESFFSPTSPECRAEFNRRLASAGFVIEGTGGGCEWAILRLPDNCGHSLGAVVLTDDDMSAPCFGACHPVAYGPDDERGEEFIEQDTPLAQRLLAIGHKALDAAGVMYTPSPLGAEHSHSVCAQDGDFQIELFFPTVEQAAAWAAGWVERGSDRLACLMQDRWTQVGQFGVEL